MLGRLRIGQKLGLLLALPLMVSVLTSAPFIIDRVDDARAATTLMDTASQARRVATFVQELQQERLMALASLAAPNFDRRALIEVMERVDDLNTELSAEFAVSAQGGLGPALANVRGVDPIRQLVLTGKASAVDVHVAYHKAVVAMIDGLDLVSRPGLDPAGTRQMTSLDALLRANEAASSCGAALLVAIREPVRGAQLIQLTQTLEPFYVANFRRQADASQAALLTATLDGPTTRQREELAKRITDPTAQAKVGPDEALAAAQGEIALRRTLQDRIARELLSGATERASSARVATFVGIGLSALIVILVLWLGIAVNRSVARPLHQLTLAASMVADLATKELVRVADDEDEDFSPPMLTAVNVRTGDEIGELASAFNRVQATAALLMEQQINTRRNVAVMFANIARRTRGLVGRQLTEIDELERDEHDEQRLAKMYRLDHVTMRLRRSADSLLVIAGSRDASGAQPSTLADVVRSAVAETEGYRQVQIGAISAVTVSAGLVPDLTLLLAELLENATAFSPPETSVQVWAELGENDCLIQIVDQGIGMKAAKLAEENRRLVERERLEHAPTKVLGLFVVGRVARRHGLQVRLLATEGGGVTAEVVVPTRFLGLTAEPETDLLPEPELLPEPDLSPEPQPLQARQLLLERRLEREELARSAELRLGAFPAETPAQASNGVAADQFIVVERANGEPPSATEWKSGLRRRERNTAEIDLPAFKPPIAERDPERERAGLDAFSQGADRAARHARPDVVSEKPVHGFARRRPGEHMSEATLDGGFELSGTRQIKVERNALAERDAVTDYLAGLARASGVTSR